jgi:hypothetical protein
MLTKRLRKRCIAGEGDEYHHRIGRHRSFKTYVMIRKEERRKRNGRAKKAVPFLIGYLFPNIFILSIDREAHCTYINRRITVQQVFKPFDNIQQVNNHAQYEINLLSAAGRKSNERSAG